MSGASRPVTNCTFVSFVMAGLVSSICKTLILLGSLHKAEDDDGEVAGLSAI